MSSSTVLSNTDDSLPIDAAKYRQIVGKLQYLSFTRPHICFVVNKLSQFMHAPSTLHWKAVKWVLRYLKSTQRYGICLRRSNSISLYMYSDADWAGDVNDRVSTTAYIQFFGNNSVSLSSKKQTTIAR